MNNDDMVITAKRIAEAVNAGNLDLAVSILKAFEATALDERLGEM